MRTSSATTSSGRATWWKVRTQAARSKEPRPSGRLVMSASTKETFGNWSARRLASSSISGTASTPTTSRTSGAIANASAPVPVPRSSTRSSPRGSRNRRRCSRTASRRDSSSSASWVALSEKRSWRASIRSCPCLRRTSSSASSRVEIVPAARSSSISSSSRPISGPGGIPSSSPRRSGPAGSTVARGLDRRDQLVAAAVQPRRVGCPRFGRPPETMDRPRGEVESAAPRSAGSERTA